MLPDFSLLISSFSSSTISCWITTSAGMLACCTTAKPFFSKLKFWEALTGMDWSASSAYWRIMFDFHLPKKATWLMLQPLLMYWSAPDLLVEWPEMSFPNSVLHALRTRCLDAGLFPFVTASDLGSPWSTSWADFTSCIALSYGHLRPQELPSHWHCNTLVIWKPSWSVLHSNQVRVTVLRLLLKLRLSTVRAAISISRIIHCTPIANNLLAIHTLLSPSSSASLPPCAQMSSGTSLAFFFGPLPRFTDNLHCLNTLSSWADQWWPFSMCISFKSFRYSSALL